MGSEATHYVVVGVVINDREEVKQFFDIAEEHFKVCEEYHDNPYKDNITETSSGIHIISDGMSGRYVVIGKILEKAIYEGISLTEIDDFKKIYRKIYPAVKELDEKLGTKFGGLDPRVVVFTHWH